MIYDAVNKKRNHIECELRCCLFVMCRIVLTNAICNCNRAGSTGDAI